jgi:membrane protein YqaA with SNARE-associated domain
MGQLATGLLSLSGWAALTLLFMLPALEAPAFLGLILPGELALLLGGVVAHQDRIPLAGALAVGVAGAVAGDTAGYWIGRHWGPRLLTSGLGRRVGPAHLHKIEGLLLRGGGWGLVVGRCTAGVRVVLPRPGRHAGPALPDLRPLDRGGRDHLGGRPCPARLCRRCRLAPCPPAHRPGRHRPGRGRDGRPGRRLAAAPPGQRTPGRAPPARRRRVAPRLGRRDEGEGYGGHRHRALTTSPSERSSLSTGRSNHADRP